MSSRPDNFSVGFFLLILVGLILCSSTCFGQQPFVTDDADVTPRRHFHFEVSNQFDVLQRSVFPSLKQNTAHFELNYGLFERVEVGLAVPLITIINARETAFFGSPTGIGDTNLSLKYNFLKERDHSRRPAMAVTLNLELPTGDVEKQLGSGLADFSLNGVVQKSLSEKTKLRVNGGILFSGNESTGAVGIQTRGTVFTGGVSLVRQFTPRLDLGVDLSVAETKSFSLAKGQLQAMLGGNYQLRKNMTFDFGIVAGKFVASPRIGVKVGISVDW